jgi:hypothetical protein
VELRKSLQLEGEGSVREEVRGKKDTAIPLAALGAALDYASSKRASAGFRHFWCFAECITRVLFFYF